MAKRLIFKPTDVELKIPRLFENATISTINNPSAKSMAQHYVDNFTELFLEGRAPVLLGASGTGKTFVAAAIAKALAPNGESGYNTPVLWVDAVEMLNDLLDLRDLRQSSAYFKLKQTIKKTPVIVLDDILQLREFERIRELLFEIINYRYSEKLPTIITANVIDARNPWDELTKEVGAPLTRRIKDMSTKLVILNK